VRRNSLLLLVAFVALGASAAGSAQAAVHEICVESAQGSPGGSAAVPLFLLDGSGVAAFQVDVRFDPSLLAFSGAQLGTDTVAAGGWALDAQVINAGIVRVIAYRLPPAGLGAGIRRVAQLTFNVVAQAAFQGVPLPLAACILGDATGASIPCATCVQPGAEAAVPRFARSLVDDGFAFIPARIVIEQGDWVLWEHHGSSRSHTTTSGTACIQDGIWRGVLNPGGRFCRQFFEPDGTRRAYFSEPDCAFGMTGEVEMTGDIQLDLSAPAQATLLSWSGGGGLYRLHRSAAPSFVGHGTVSFAPVGGAAGTTFTDAESPPAGQSFFYIVVNAF